MTNKIRPIAILDLCVLVMATAAGFALCRLSYDQLGGRATIANVSELLTECIVILVPQLACWTLPVLLISLRSPRPSWRRMMRQPGFLAIVVSCIAIMGQGLLHYMDLWGRGRDFTVADWNTRWLSFLNINNWQFVAGAWLALAFSGRWRWGRTWAEVICLGLGVGWFVVYLAWEGRIFF